MIDWVNTFYFSINIVALLLSVMGLWFTAIMPGFDQWNRRFFLGYFAIYVLCCISTLADEILACFPAPSAALHFIVILECLGPSLPLPMLTAYLLYCCGENVRRSRLLRIALGLWAVYFVLLMSASFIGGFSYVVPDNWYYFGPEYPLPLLPLSLILLFNLAGLIRRRKRLSHKTFLAFLIATLPMAGTMLAQLFVDVTMFLDISCILSALAMYSLILSDHIERDMRQQQEIAQQRISVMVLQMRPHFIYNTLMCIYSLCNQDPKKARQVTLDFTNYLRNNFNAVVSRDPILFSRELEDSPFRDSSVSLTN